MLSKLLANDAELGAAWHQSPRQESDLSKHNLTWCDIERLQEKTAPWCRNSVWVGAGVGGVGASDTSGKLSL